MYSRVTVAQILIGSEVSSCLFCIAFDKDDWIVLICGIWNQKTVKNMQIDFSCLISYNISSCIRYSF